MLGLGVSLLRSNRPLGELTAKLAYDLGDKTANGGIIYYTNPPDLNATSTLSFEALPYSIKFPKDSQDNFYDYNSSEELVYTIPSTRILDVTNNFTNIYEGIVKDNWVVLKRDNGTFTDINDDEKLIGWFNYVYSQNKDNFDKGLYFFPNEVDSVNQTKGAVFSTDTELFYDNVDISDLNVHVCVSAAVVNTYTNLFPTPLEVPLVTPTEGIFSIFPNELLASGLSVQNVAKEVRYNQRYHKYTDYKDEITFEDTLSTNDTNKEFRPTNSVCLSQLNKQIVIQVPQHRFGQKAPAPWRANKNITMTGEIACLGPYASEAPAGVIYQPFEVEDNYLNFVDTSSSSIYGTMFISVRRFVITKDILDPLFIASLNRTVAQATYTLNSEDGDGTHKLLYFKIRNIRFKSPGYLPSRNTLSTSMTESILVPTIQDTLVTNVQSYATLVVGSFNQTSLKSTNQLNPLAISSSTSNTGRLYNITPVGLEGYNLGDIQEFSQVKYEASSGTVSADQKYIGTSIQNPTKQIYYRVKAKIFSWVDESADTFDNIQIRLIRQNTIDGSTIVVESTTLTPEDMELIVRVTNDFADTHYRFDISNTLNYTVSAVNALFVDVKITPKAVFESQYDSGDIGFIRFDAETELEAQNFPVTPSSPITYTIPTIPTYNE